MDRKVKGEQREKQETTVVTATMDKMEPMVQKAIL